MNYYTIIIGAIFLLFGAILLIIGIKHFMRRTPTVKCSLLIFGSVIMIIGFRILGAK
jgi:hypothetical protein